MIDQRSGIHIADEFKLLLPVNRLVPAPWNPNKQSEKTFNNLVANIQETGFDETVEVVPLDDAHEEMRRKYLSTEQYELAMAGELFYLIVGGHHRWEAAKVLDMEFIPGVLKPQFDEDMVKFQNVRRNMLRGKMDPLKFTTLYNEVAEKYGEDLAREAMALMDDREFKALVQNVRDELPPELQKKLDEAKDDVKNVDDLSRILNELFSRHGDTLELSYMVFTFGGKTHLWVAMDRPIMKDVEALKEFCYNNRYNINDAFTVLLENAKTRLDAVKDTLIPVETATASVSFE